MPAMTFSESPRSNSQSSKTDKKKTRGRTGVDQRGEQTQGLDFNFDFDFDLLKCQLITHQQN